MNKLIAFSGIQPTGGLTIGNYIGALHQWINLQNIYKCIYCIADLHSLTKVSNKFNLNKLILNNLALYLSCGVNPNKSIIFVQSHLHQHTELCWVLGCYTKFSELNHMNQFKKKINNKNINAGLFNYPILMAADILLYQSNIVPVGNDQKQHIELTCNIAKRFNYIYGKVFTIPKALINLFGSRIMSLKNPFLKMSKSDNNINNIIYLLDENESVIKKIKSSITDSDKFMLIIYDPIKKPGISNLLNILSGLTNISIRNLEKFFIGKTYSYLKLIIIDVLLDFINSLRLKYNIFRVNQDYLFKIIDNGFKIVDIYANFTLKKVYKKLNLLI